MQKISRKKNRLALLSMVLFVAFLLIGRLLYNGILTALSTLFMVLMLVLLFTANRCPACGEYFRGIFWSKPTAGYCRKCGKLIEFDDSGNN